MVFAMLLWHEVIELILSFPRPTRMVTSSCWLTNSKRRLAKNNPLVEVCLVLEFLVLFEDELREHNERR